MVFVFSLLDCCALIFLSVYFVSLPEAGGGRPGALRPRGRAGVGPRAGSRERGRWPASGAGSLGAGTAGGEPGLEEGPTLPLTWGSKGALLSKRPGPACPPPLAPRDARTRSAMRQPWHLAFPCGLRGRGSRSTSFLALEREGSRFVLQLPWARPFA